MGTLTSMSVEAPCLYPGCVQFVNFGLAPGRRALFCSDVCRTNFNNANARLSRHVGELRTALVSREKSGRVATTEELHELAHAEWLLARFRPVAVDLGPLPGHGRTKPRRR